MYSITVARNSNSILCSAQRDPTRRTFQRDARFDRRCQGHSAPDGDRGLLKRPDAPSQDATAVRLGPVDSDAGQRRAERGLPAGQSRAPERAAHLSGCGSLEAHARPARGPSGARGRWRESRCGDASAAAPAVWGRRERHAAGRGAGLAARARLARVGAPRRRAPVRHAEGGGARRS